MFRSESCNQSSFDMVLEYQVLEKILSVQASLQALDHLLEKTSKLLRFPALKPPKMHIFSESLTIDLSNAVSHVSIWHTEAELRPSGWNFKVFSILSNHTLKHAVNCGKSTFPTFFQNSRDLRKIAVGWRHTHQNDGIELKYLLKNF